MVAIVETVGLNNQGEEVTGLLGVEFEGFVIVNPFFSECGRFEVEPSVYGLAADEADRIWKHNAPLLAGDEDLSKNQDDELGFEL